jgi:DNA-binding NtrC family response regulator
LAEKKGISMNDTILIVDDEAHVLETCRKILSGKAYACKVFSCPQKALKAAEMINPAVVVSDQRMPGMKGTVFLEKIRKKLPNATRIIMTGYADIDVAIQAINMGHVFRFIKKPWDDMEFTSQIRDAVEYAHMNQRLQQVLNTDETNNPVVQERLQGVLEMARTVCHEFAQPLAGDFRLLRSYDGHTDRGPGFHSNGGPACRHPGSNRATG